MSGLIVTVFWIVFYFVPTIVAHNRKHVEVNSIVVLNILLGWTCLGWVAALVWSFSSNVYSSDIEEDND